LPGSDDFSDGEKTRLKYFKGGEHMKKILVILLFGFLFLPPSFAQPPFGPRLQPGDLKVVQLEMRPDPVREGQRVSFEAIVSNLSQHPWKVSLFIKDKDEVVSAVYDIRLRPGDNRIDFPQSHYKFSRDESCFTVEVDIERTRRPVDVGKEFCARRTPRGWTMASLRVGPLFVEDLDMNPDPVRPGQEIRFKARLRNDGGPIRADIRIQDRDQVVIQLNDVFLPRGHSEFQFPYTRYQFQRFDHCFTVIVDVERTPHRADAAREFCAKPFGWSLRP
jgi:hypothetical protein